MRMLIKEADLRELSGLTEDRLDPEEYRKMRQYLKIDRLIFGTFSINADEINIQTKIIDHDTGDKLASFSQTGAEQSETHQLCVNYMNEFNNYMKSKQFTTEDYYKEYAAYYLNNFKMAATLPQ